MTIPDTRTNFPTQLASKCRMGVESIEELVRVTWQGGILLNEDDSS